uniref:FRIGIDA-like protein n=1 Tax=Wollemia nobilis TaxID=56998 RepID=A0A0C9RUP6_9CONI
MDTLEARKQRLEEAFTALDTQRVILDKCTLQWRELSGHYGSLEQSLDKKFEELAEKEKTLEIKTKEMEELLEKREQSIEDNEKNYIARAEEQKKSALEAIEKGKGESELKFLCQKMDAEGLWKYMAEHRRDVQAVRTELPAALECAVDPARLVLEFIEGFYGKNGEEKGENSKKVFLGLADKRRACSLLLESVVSVLADPVLGADRPVVAEGFKQRAKVIAEEWRSKIDVEGDPKPLEVQAFFAACGHLWNCA